LEQRDYAMTIVNLTTQEEAPGYVTWSAELVNNRYVRAAFNTRFLPTGMYIVTFFTANPVRSYVHLAYASPGGNTALPQTDYTADDDADIYIYHGE